MRILLVAPAFYPSNDGYANAIASFVLELVRRRQYEITVLTPTSLMAGVNELSEKRLTIHRLPPFRGRIRYFLQEAALAYYIKRLDSNVGYDVIFFETAEFPIAILLTLRSAERLSRTVVRVHASAETEWPVYRDHVLYRLKRPWIRAAFQRIPVILSTNSYHLEFVMERILKKNPFVLGSKILQVLPNTSWSHIESKVGAWGRVWEQRLQGKISILIAGRMNYPGFVEKNFVRVFEALARCRSVPRFKRLQVICVGEGEGLRLLKEFARRLDLESRTVFLEPLSNAEMQALQAQVNFVVLASLHEGMSSFGLESLKNGAGLLFSRSSGVRDLVLEGENGFLFDPFDLDAMTLAFRRALVELGDRRNEVRKVSQALYNSRFHPDHVVEIFDTLLGQMAVRKGIDLSEL